MGDHRPVGYPAEFERWVQLQDGRRVSIRPIVPGDAAELAEAIRTADPVTLRRRFLGAAPSVTPRLLDYLTVIDYVTRFALVARAGHNGAGAAVARYEGLGDGSAEIAVVVDPAWRRVGLATALVHLLAEAALTRGIHSFTGIYLADNHPVAALLAEAGGASLIKEGIAELQVILDPDPPQRRHPPGLPQ